LLKIRPFQKGSDEAIFVRIYNAAFSDYDDIRNMTLEEMVKTEEHPAFTTEGIFIVEWNGETAGMVHAYVDKLREDQKGFIQSLGVLPEFRGKGIARKLVENAIESLKQRGMKLADAWAQTDREACIHLFESFGFKQVRATSMMKRALSNTPSDTGENEEISTREMRLKDDNDIALANRLENEAFKEHFNFRLRTIEETKYTLQEIPWFQDQAGLFALLGGQPVGYVITGIDEGLNKEKNLKYGWILDIGVLKPYRRRRIGTSLMLGAMQRLKDQGMEDAVLYVDDMNPTGAFRLYEKLGFKVARKSIIYQLKIG
jgi:mycothiol synthase